MVSLARGRSIVASGLVGVFERGDRIQRRLEKIMQFDTIRKTSGIVPQIAVVILALMFLPMAPWESDGTSRAAAASEPAQTATSATATNDAAPSPPEKTPYPQIVSMEPAAGSTDVDPKLAAIRVKFDRAMSKGMSWTGGGPEFPPVDRSRKARWIDDRTCILPVKLKRRSYYRLGINSKSYQNFRSADGTPTPPTALFFTTKGASQDQKNRVLMPQIVKLEPANDSMDVSPETKELRVTFNMPMGRGMSWTGGGDKFPESLPGKRASWSKDALTCTLPVSLNPNHDYRLGLNSLSHNNFQSKWGVPLTPIVYSFRTTAANQ